MPRSRDIAFTLMPSTEFLSCLEYSVSPLLGYGIACAVDHAPKAKPLQNTAPPLVPRRVA